MDRVLQALADPTRRQILDLLARGEMSAGDISANFPDISRPAVSQHLAVLRDAGLVHQQKKGRHQWYRLEVGPLKEFWENWLSKYELFWKNRLFALKQVVEEEQKRNEEDKEES